MTMLAQADPVQAVGDLVHARDVVPFQSAALLIVLIALVYLFRLRESERKEHLEHLKLVNDRLLDQKDQKKEGDSHG